VTGMVLCLACFVGLMTNEALASPTNDALPEIIVTGERVPRALRETSSSVVVVTDREIEAASGADRLEQMLALIPNVQPGSGNDGPTIRGQDSTGVLRELQAFLGGTRPRVTTQVDGRAVGYFEFNFGAASVWDVGQIEVFRSPQTTTQGRNSIGGAIFVRTNDPTYVWEGRARAVAGNLTTRQGSAAVSGPIVADQLAFRVAGDFRRERTSSTITDRIPDADPNRDEYGVVRVKLLAEPKSLPGARLETTYVHTQSRAPQIAAVKRPFEERRGDALPMYGVFDTDVDSLTGVLDYTLSPAIASTTTLSYGDALIRRLNQPGLGVARIDTGDFSVESVLRWHPDGPVQLIGGINHFRTQLDQFIDVTTFPPLRGSGSFDDRQTSLGLFGDATIKVVPRLAITAGVRYQRDSQERQGFLTTFREGFSIDYDENFGAWLPKFSMAYDFADEVTGGILVQRAYNPGGVTISLDTGEQDEFDAETLWSYEIFTRAQLARGVGIAANLFYSDMSNAQRPQQRTVTFPDGTQVFVTEFDNMPAAESYGAELELDWRVGRRLSLRAGIGLLRTRITKTAPASDQLLGKEFQRSPEFTAAATVDWQPVEPLRVSAQLRHNSDYFSNDANNPALRIEEKTLVDGRVAYVAGPLTFFGYVRNLFDDFYLTLLTSPNLGSVGDPREFGFGLEGRF
jgi:outer membrane receptor protein involved in Fe transport